MQILRHTILNVLPLRPLHPNLTLHLKVLVGERSPTWVKSINATHSSIKHQVFALTWFLFTCCASHLASAEWLVVHRRRLRLSWQSFKRLLFGSSNLSNYILALVIACIAVFILLLEVVGMIRSLRLRVIGRGLLAMMRWLSYLVNLNPLGWVLARTHLHSVVGWGRLTITGALVGLVRGTFLSLTLLNNHSSSWWWSTYSSDVEISFSTSCAKSFWMLMTMIWNLECCVLLLSVHASLRSWRRRRDLLEGTCLWMSDQMAFIWIGLLILGCCLHQGCLDVVCLICQWCWPTFRIDLRWVSVGSNLILN